MDLLKVLGGTFPPHPTFPTMGEGLFLDPPPRGGLSKDLTQRALTPALSLPERAGVSGHRG
jgi:hypothetical protein